MAIDLYPWEPLRERTGQLLLAAGSPVDEANLVSDLLVKANLAGVESHGVRRLPQYLDRVRRGMLKPGQVPVVKKDIGAIALVAGNRGYGQVAAHHAMSLAIERANTTGISAVGVADNGHIGRLADFAIMAATAGKIGLVFTSGGGASRWVAPFGGASGRVGATPLAAAFPTDHPFPVFVDVSLSTVSQGKVLHWAEFSQRAPEGVLIDQEGRPTTDPKALASGGAVLPLGGRHFGYKGFAIGFMVEVISGILIAGAYSGVPDAREGGNCSMMIAIDTMAFRPLPTFKQELEDFISFLSATPPLEGCEVLIPGELEARVEQHRRAHGIPLDGGTVAKLQAEMDYYGVDVTLTDLVVGSDAEIPPEPSETNGRRTRKDGEAS